jgi:hypothetical protein
VLRRRQRAGPGDGNPVEPFGRHHHAGDALDKRRADHHRERRTDPVDERDKRHQHDVGHDLAPDQQQHHDDQCHFDHHDRRCDALAEGAR